MKSAAAHSPICSKCSAHHGWSQATGSTACGIPARHTAATVPAPPWCTAPQQKGSSQSWGTADRWKTFFSANLLLKWIRKHWKVGKMNGKYQHLHISPRIWESWVEKWKWGDNGWKWWEVEIKKHVEYDGCVSENGIPINPGILECAILRDRNMRVQPKLCLNRNGSWGFTWFNDLVNGCQWCKDCKK